MDPDELVCRKFKQEFRNQIQMYGENVDGQLFSYGAALNVFAKRLNNKPHSKQINDTWNELMGSVLQSLLNIERRPSEEALQKFDKLLQSWREKGSVISEIKGNIEILHYLAENGAWLLPPLQRLVESEDVNISELAEVLDNESPVVFLTRVKILNANSKSKSVWSLFNAALTREKFKKSKQFQEAFQIQVVFNMNEEEMVSYYKDFDFQVTLELIDKFERNGEPERMMQLCNSVLLYMWQTDTVTSASEMTEKWCKMKLAEFKSGEKFVDFVREVALGVGKGPSSVTHCLILMQIVRKMLKDPSRIICVEILVRALHLLTKEEDPNNQNKIRILETIAELLPKSNVARLCFLSVFFLEPCIETYLAVAKKFQSKLHDVNSSKLRVNLQTELMLYIGCHFPSEYKNEKLEWDSIKKDCLSKLSPDDVLFLQKEELRNSPNNDKSSEDTGTEDTSSSIEDSSPPNVGFAKEPECSCPEGKVCSVCQEKKKITAKEKSPKKKKKAKKKKFGWTCPVLSCKMVSGRMKYMCQHLKSKHEWDSEEIRAFTKSLGVSRTAVWTSESDKFMSFTKDVDDSGLTESSSPDPNEDPTSPRLTVNVGTPSLNVEPSEKDGLINHAEQICKSDHDHDNTSSADCDKVSSSTSPTTEEQKNLVPNAETPPVPSSGAEEEKSSHKSKSQPTDQKPLVSHEQIPNKDPTDNDNDTIPHSAKVDSPVKAASTAISVPKVENSTISDKNSKAKKISPSDKKATPITSPLKGKVKKHKHLKDHKIKSKKKEIKKAPTSAVAPPKEKKTRVPSEKPPKRRLSHKESLNKKSEKTKIDTQTPKTPTQPKTEILPALPDIFPSFPTEESSELKKAASEMSEKVDKTSQGYICPLPECNRIFMHKHTIEAHIKFRHKKNKDEAIRLAAMAKEATVEEEEVQSGASPSISTTAPQIVRSRGWFHKVDFYIHEHEEEEWVKPMTEKTPLRNSLVGSLRLLFNKCPPASFNYNVAANYIISDWPSLKPTQEQHSSDTDLESHFSSVTAQTEDDLFNMAGEKAEPQKNDSSPPSSENYANLMKKAQSITKVKVKVSPKSPDPPPSGDSSPTTVIPTKIERISKSIQTLGPNEQLKSGTYHEIPQIHLPKVKKSYLDRAKYNPSPTVMSGLAFGKVFTRTIATQAAIYVPPSTSKKDGASKPTQKILETPTKHKFKKPHPTSSPTTIPLKTNEKAPLSQTTVRKKSLDSQKIERVKETIISSSEASAPKQNKVMSFEEALEDPNRHLQEVDAKSKTKPQPDRRSLDPVIRPEQKLKQKRSASADSNEPKEKMKVRKVSHSAERQPSTNGEKRLKADDGVKKKHHVKAHRRHISETHQHVEPSSQEVPQLEPSTEVKDYKDLLKQAEEISSNNTSEQTKEGNMVPMKKIKHAKEKESSTHKASASSFSTTVQSGKEKAIRKAKLKSKRSIALRRLSNVGMEEEDSEDGKIHKHSRHKGITQTSKRENPLEGSLSKTTAVDEESSSSAQSTLASESSSNYECRMCGRVMANGFALTCHMRKKHRSKAKMFIPGQTGETKIRIHSSSPSKSTKKHPGASKVPDNKSSGPKNDEPVHTDRPSSDATCAQAETPISSSETSEAAYPTIDVPMDNMVTALFSASLREMLELKRSEILRTDQNKFFQDLGVVADSKYRCPYKQCSKLAWLHLRSFQRHLDSKHKVVSGELFMAILQLIQINRLKQCFFCLASFDDYPALEMHFQNMHIDKKDQVTYKSQLRRLLCHVCRDASFYNPYSLFRHLNRTHYMKFLTLRKSGQMNPIIKTCLSLGLPAPKTSPRDNTNMEEKTESTDDSEMTVQNRDTKPHSLCEECIKDTTMLCDAAGTQSTDDAEAAGMQSTDDAEAAGMQSTDDAESIDLECEETMTDECSCAHEEGEKTTDEENPDSSSYLEDSQDDMSKQEEEVAPDNVCSLSRESIIYKESSESLPAHLNSSNEFTDLYGNRTSVNPDIAADLYSSSHEELSCPKTEVGNATHLRRLAYTQAARKIARKTPEKYNRKRWAEFQNLAYLYNKRAMKKVAMALASAKKKVEKSQDSASSSSSSLVVLPANLGANLTRSCWLCKDSFNFDSSLNYTNHILHHLRSIDRYENRCDFPGCLYGFKTEDELDAHILLHEGGIHICLFCKELNYPLMSSLDLLDHESQCHSSVVNDLARLRERYCINRFRKSERRARKLFSHTAIKEEADNCDNDSGAYCSSDQCSAEHFLGCRHRKHSRIRTDIGQACCAYNLDNLQSFAPEIQTCVCDIMTDVMETLEEAEQLPQDSSSSHILQDQLLEEVIQDSSDNLCVIKESTTESLSFTTVTTVEPCHQSGQSSSTATSPATDALPQVTVTTVQPGHSQGNDRNENGSLCGDVSKVTVKTLFHLEKDSNTDHATTAEDSPLETPDTSTAVIAFHSTNNDTEDGATGLEAAPILVSEECMAVSALDPYRGCLGEMLFKISQGTNDEYDVLCVEVAQVLDAVISQVECIEQCRKFSEVGHDKFAGFMRAKSETYFGEKIFVISSAPHSNIPMLEYPDNEKDDVSTLQSHTSLTTVTQEGDSHSCDETNTLPVIENKEEECSSAENKKEVQIMNENKAMMKSAHEKKKFEPLFKEKKSFFILPPFYESNRRPFELSMDELKKYINIMSTTTRNSFSSDKSHTLAIEWIGKEGASTNTSSATLNVKASPSPSKKQSINKKKSSKVHTDTLMDGVYETIRRASFKTKTGKNRKFSIAGALKDPFRTKRGRPLKTTNVDTAVATTVDVKKEWPADEQFFLKMFPSLATSSRKKKKKLKRSKSLSESETTKRKRTKSVSDELCKKFKSSQSFENSFLLQEESTVPAPKNASPVKNTLGGSLVPTVKRLDPLESVAHHGVRVRYASESSHGYASPSKVIPVVPHKSSINPSHSYARSLAFAPYPSKMVKEKRKMLDPSSWKFAQSPTFDSPYARYKKAKAESAKELRTKNNQILLMRMVCGVCLSDVPAKDLLQHHIDHVVNRNFKHECKFPGIRCYFGTNNHQELQKHYMRHSGGRPHLCMFCSHSFASTKEVDIHLGREHRLYKERFYKELATQQQEKIKNFHENSIPVREPGHSRVSNGKNMDNVGCLERNRTPSTEVHPMLSNLLDKSAGKERAKRKSVIVLARTPTGDTTHGSIPSHPSRLGSMKNDGKRLNTNTNPYTRHSPVEVNRSWQNIEHNYMKRKPDYVHQSKVKIRMVTNQMKMENNFAEVKDGKVGPNLTRNITQMSKVNSKVQNESDTCETMPGLSNITQMSKVNSNVQRESDTCETVTVENEEELKKANDIAEKRSKLLKLLTDVNQDVVEGSGVKVQDDPTVIEDGSEVECSEMPLPSCMELEVLAPPPAHKPEKIDLEVARPITSVDSVTASISNEKDSILFDEKSYIDECMEESNITIPTSEKLNAMSNKMIPALDCESDTPGRLFEPSEQESLSNLYKLASFCCNAERNAKASKKVCEKDTKKIQEGAAQSVGIIPTSTAKSLVLDPSKVVTHVSESNDTAGPSGLTEVPLNTGGDMVPNTREIKKWIYRFIDKKIKAIPVAVDSPICSSLINTSSKSPSTTKLAPSLLVKTDMGFDRPINPTSKASPSMVSSNSTQNQSVHLPTNTLDKCRKRSGERINLPRHGLSLSISPNPSTNPNKIKLPTARIYMTTPQGSPTSRLIQIGNQVVRKVQVVRPVIRSQSYSEFKAPDLATVRHDTPNTQYSLSNRIQNAFRRSTAQSSPTNRQNPTLNSITSHLPATLYISVAPRSVTMTPVNPSVSISQGIAGHPNPTSSIQSSVMSTTPFPCSTSSSTNAFLPVQTTSATSSSQVSRKQTHQTLHERAAHHSSSCASKMNGKLKMKEQQKSSSATSNIGRRPSSDRESIVSIVLDDESVAEMSNLDQDNFLDEDTVSCAQCGEIFLTEEELKNHSVGVHMNVICYYAGCMEIYDTREKLETHLKKVHGIGKKEMDVEKCMSEELEYEVWYNKGGIVKCQTRRECPLYMDENATLNSKYARRIYEDITSYILKAKYTNMDAADTDGVLIPWKYLTCHLPSCEYTCSDRESFYHHIFAAHHINQVLRFLRNRYRRMMKAKNRVKGKNKRENGRKQNTGPNRKYSGNVSSNNNNKHAEEDDQTIICKQCRFEGCTQIFFSMKNRSDHLRRKIRFHMQTHAMDCRFYERGPARLPIFDSYVKLDCGLNMEQQNDETYHPGEEICPSESSDSCSSDFLDEDQDDLSLVLLPEEDDYRYISSSDEEEDMSCSSDDVSSEVAMTTTASMIPCAVNIARSPVSLKDRVFIVKNTPDHTGAPVPRIITFDRLKDINGTTLLTSSTTNIQSPSLIPLKRRLSVSSLPELSTSKVARVMLKKLEY